MATSTAPAAATLAVGYIPSAGGTQTLPRVTPPGIAADLILTGEPIDHVAALRWGLVSRVVAPEALDAAVEETVADLLASGDQPDRRTRVR